MGFIEVMKERDMLAQITHEDELKDHLASGTRTVYGGFDPTADSLHVGHLVLVMALRRWQQAGHRVVALVGGGTGLIGDPTGKTEMRKMLTSADIEHNLACLKNQLSHFLDFSSESKGIVVNNADWLKELNYIDVLREIGPHFSVNRMLTAECFKQRLEKGLSFLEFNYMILQSYDFLHLYRSESCSVQMGGDDQWSNMLGGVELVRRLTPGKAYCVTLPLLTTSSGKKMGKTEDGAVWLDPAKTSPYQYYQYWRNVEDAMVKTCLSFFTELPVAEVNALAALEGAAINEAKERLAYECTLLLHGAVEADQARDTAKKLFSAGGGAAEGEPLHYVTRADFGGGMKLVDLLTASGVFESKGEVRRLVKQGGLLLNGEKVVDPDYNVQEGAFQGDEGILLKKGKKHYYRIRFS